MSYLKAFRDHVGVAVYDWRRYHRAFSEPTSSGSEPPRGWISLCNRIEKLIANPAGPGVQCDWKWGSDLHACLVWPSLGRELFRVALEEWPIEFVDEPRETGGPRLSFIFAHGGRDRLPQLRRTLRSLFAQEGVAVECVVIDQTEESIRTELPDGITYHHLSKVGVAQGWHKSWAYNVGARAASGDILVFHDGDICAPKRYGQELARTILSEGYDAASLHRFLFYLSSYETELVEQCDTLNSRLTPQRIYQNWKGGTIAIRRDAFLSIGGFDEGFVDWGGEDDEFYDRCRQTLRHCRYGYLPFVHLWHPPQPDRRASDNVNISRIMPWRMELPIDKRLRELSQREFGSLAGPDPAVSYKAQTAETSN